MPYIAFYDTRVVSRNAKLEEHWYPTGTFEDFLRAGHDTGEYPHSVLEICESKIYPDYGRYGYAQIMLIVDAKEEADLDVDKLGILRMLQKLASRMSNGTLLLGQSDWGLKSASFHAKIPGITA